MHVHYGCALEIVLAREADVRAVVALHPEQRRDLVAPDVITAYDVAADRPLDLSDVGADAFGNLVHCFRAGPGPVRLQSSGVVHHGGFPDLQDPLARSASVPELPPEVRRFLLPSLRCAADDLADHARALFEPVPDGWPRVQAICDYVGAKMRFDPELALQELPAREVWARRAGAARDLVHVAILFCRALGVPARLCLGYLGDREAAPAPAFIGFHAWFEGWLDGRWLTFDPTQGAPRIGRVLVARGADAADAPAIAADAPFRIARFGVTAVEEDGARFPFTARERLAHWDAHLGIGEAGRRGAESGPGTGE